MATGAPGTNGVWQYGEDDSEATFSALLNKAASTTDTAIGVDRGRLTSLEGRATTLEARRIAGLVPIIPTSVAINAGTVSYNTTTGLVSFTNGAAVTINGVFSSSFQNYRIIFDIESSSAAADIYFQLKNSGGTLATGWNTWFTTTTTAPAVSGGYVSNTFGGICGRTNGTAGAHVVLDVLNPNAFRIKRFSSLSNDASVIRHCGGLNQGAGGTQYTDLLMVVNGQNAQVGTVKVYGYN